MRRPIGSRTLVAVLSVSLSWLGFVPTAGAGAVTTQQYLELQAQQTSGDRLQAWVASDAVRAQLVTLGVAPAEIEARLAALTSEEQAQLAERIDSMPAGGDALALIGAVFVILLVLELVGVIDIFKKA
jgi:hypothetical protein